MCFFGYIFVWLNVIVGRLIMCDLLFVMIIVLVMYDDFFDLRNCIMDVILDGCVGWCSGIFVVIVVQFFFCDVSLVCVVNLFIFLFVIGVCIYLGQIVFICILCWLQFCVSVWVRLISVCLFIVYFVIDGLVNSLVSDEMIMIWFFVLINVGSVFCVIVNVVVRFVWIVVFQFVLLVLVIGENL